MSKRHPLAKLTPTVKTIRLDTVSSPSTQRITGRELQRIRRRILLRDEHTCQRCRHVFRASKLEVDHVVPLHLDGAEADYNRQTLCVSCHSIKTEVEKGRRGGNGN